MGETKPTTKITFAGSEVNSLLADFISSFTNTALLDRDTHYILIKLLPTEWKDFQEYLRGYTALVGNPVASGAVPLLAIGDLYRYMGYTCVIAKTNEPVCSMEAVAYDFKKAQARPNREKIINGFLYTTDPFLDKVHLSTGAGGARALYDELANKGMSDELIGSYIGLAIKGGEFIPLSKLELNYDPAKTNDERRSHQHSHQGN